MSFTMCHRTLVLLVGVGKKVMEWKLTFRPYLSAWGKRVECYQLAFQQVWCGQAARNHLRGCTQFLFILRNGPRHRNVFALCLCWIHASVFINTVSTDCSLWLKVQLFWLSVYCLHRINNCFTSSCSHLYVCATDSLDCGPEAKDFTVYVSAATQHQPWHRQILFYWALLYKYFYRYYMFFWQPCIKQGIELLSLMWRGLCT